MPATTPQPANLPFFVYGTLQRGECRQQCWPHAPLKVVPAQTRGRLLDLGEYPALVAGPYLVYGELWYFAPEHLPYTFDVIDEVEGYRPGEPSLYERKVVECWTGDGQPQWAYAYVYAQYDPAQAIPEWPPDPRGACDWRRDSRRASGRPSWHDDETT